MFFDHIALDKHALDFVDDIDEFTKKLSKRNIHDVHVIIVGWVQQTDDERLSHYSKEGITEVDGRSVNAIYLHDDLATKGRDFDLAHKVVLNLSKYKNGRCGEVVSDKGRYSFVYSF